MLLSFFNEIRKCHLHFSMKDAILIYMKYNRNIKAFNGNFGKGCNLCISYFKEQQVLV